ncbi:hypothetical protein LLH23_01365 [bacterium]|nr:hypothetical protein [bacterium]
MAGNGLHVTIHNQTNPDVATTFLMAPEVLWRRLELAAQGVALEELGSSLAGGTPLQLRVACQGQTTASGRLRLVTCRIEVRASDGTVATARDLPMSAVLLMETKALVEALSSHHNIFLPGDRATAALYVDQQAVPEVPVFDYVLPDCDYSVKAREAMLTAQAGAVISQLVAMTDEAEQRAFSVGVLGPGGVPVVTDVIVPPGAAEGAGAATVQFSPEDWAYAQDSVAAMGPPFRILGPCHTHPYGLIAPSPMDWDLCLWSAGAEGLFIIAASVGQQPTAAGFRWINGSLQQVNLHIEAGPETEPVTDDQEVESCLG